LDDGVEKHTTLRLSTERSPEAQSGTSDYDFREKGTKEDSQVKRKIAI
jgi:hypothetical protein